MDSCFFCQHILEHDFAFENDLAVARYDDLEVIPKRHVKDWWETTPEERIAIFDLLDQAKEILDQKYHPDGYNIGMNLGVDAGQSILHLHVHLIPRYHGDVPNPRGGVRGIIPRKQNY